ncbi:MAG: hypothetical protein K8F25_11425 [Fimbriimonadaceae bacterium]|nr:hypothetical protein [Alphaproteobacteria bacterium]
MFGFFQVGLIAAWLQGAFVWIVTNAFMFAALHSIAISGPYSLLEGTPGVSEWMESHLILLRYSYFFIALGLTLTHNRFVDVTVEHIRQASHRIDPNNPDRASKFIFSQLIIAAICFAIATLHSPPSILAVISGHIENGWINSAAWSGIMSVVFAGIGANAAAAKTAISNT